MHLWWAQLHILWCIDPRTAFKFMKKFQKICSERWSALQSGSEESAPRHQKESRQRCRTRHWHTTPATVELKTRHSKYDIKSKVNTLRDGVRIIQFVQAKSSLIPKGAELVRMVRRDAWCNTEAISETNRMRSTYRYPLEVQGSACGTSHLKHVEVWGGPAQWWLHALGARTGFQ